MIGLFEDLCEFALTRKTDLGGDFRYGFVGMGKQEGGAFHAVFTDMGGDGIAVGFFEDLLDGCRINQKMPREGFDGDVPVEMLGQVFVYFFGQIRLPARMVVAVAGAFLIYGTARAVGVVV